MGHRLNLSHLTEEECELILKVIQKDFDLRQLEKDRLAHIEAKVKEEDARLNILATREDFNDKYCMICFKKFLFFFIPRTQCYVCKHYYCKDCISFDIRLKTDTCNSCQKYHAFLLQSNPWFYKRLGDKFKRFGSAKVIRSLYKRKTESDAESDSGYHPSVNGSVFQSEPNARRSRPNLSKVFELDETHDNLQKNENDEDEPLQTLSCYKQKLEAIKRQLQKAYLESTGAQQSSQKSIYKDALNKQNFNISLLLSAMVNDMTSNLNESGTKDQNASKETISKYVLEQCIDHIYESSSSEIDSYHPFGIDPEDLTLRGYIEKLSEAILSKMDVDLKSSEGKIFRKEVEEEVQKKPLKSTNRAGITQVQKGLSDSELEDLHVTTDSISDIDGREWQTRNSADSMSVSSSVKQKAPNRIDYDESEYDVDENSIFAFASRKKGTLVLPELDSHSSLQQSDIDLDLTSQKEYSSDEDPWTLSANGPATVMSNRIPIAPYDNYGKKKCGPTETEGDLKMFLPKRHSIEGPMIDNMNVYELSDLSDTSMDSPFEEVHNRKAASLKEEVPEKINQHRSENDSRDSFHDSIQPLIPWFEMVPQDVHVLLGEEFTCSCKPNGAKPVDVFWYRDGKELIQIGSDERHSLLSQGVLHWLIVSSSQTSDSGMYLCVAINEHGTCQHTFTVTVIERNEFHERSVDTNRRKNLGMGRLANTHQDKPELNTGLPPTTTGTVDTEDGKDIAIRASDVDISQKRKQDSSTNIASHVPATSNKKAQNSQNILHIQEDVYKKSKKDEHTLYDEQDNDNSHYSSQKRQNSELSERTKQRSSTTYATGRNYRDSHSANETDKYTKSEIMKETPHGRNVFADISLQKTDEKNLPRRFHTVASYEGEVLSKTESHPLPATSHSDNLKMMSGRIDFLEDAKSLGPQNQDSIDAQYPRAFDAGLPVIDYKRYSRDYEVRNKDNSSAIRNEQSKAIERKISNDTNRLTRRTDSSSTSESDVFETGRSSAGSTTQTTIQSSAKSDFDDISLPSVKQLRMKFSAPQDTSAAEALLQRKNRTESKIYQDAELRLKSTERNAPPFPSSFLPVSVVPLQPEPVNSRSASRSSVSKDNLSPQSRPEIKFQKEVTIRQQTVNKIQSDEIDKELELDESDPSHRSSISGRMVIRPFSQRTGSTNTETRTRYHSK